MKERIGNQGKLTNRYENILSSIWKKLPNIAKNLIQNSLDLSNERNRKFFEDPDNPLEHAPNWHQWGVITHTKMFEKFYREEIPVYFDKWGIRDQVQEYLSEKIDGVSKEQLLGISIPFHDLGKFTERELRQKNDGSIYTTFNGHESASGTIIRSATFSKMLKQEFGLTDAQIEYIACCAELHYELGIVREMAKKSDLGYTLAFAHSTAFHEHAEQLMVRYPDFQLEVGVLFLADSLAKTDTRIESGSDEQIGDQGPVITELLKKRNLNPKLINAVKQLPINRTVAETYLKIWAAAH